MYRAILNFLGKVLILFSNLTAIGLLVTLLMPGTDVSRDALSFGITLAASLLLGITFLRLSPHAPEYLATRETFVVVIASWFLVVLLGSLPFWLSGACRTFLDAFFESMSGFTTTGSSIFPVVESLPPGILFWRAYIQWLGGMGIIAFFLVVLPAVGVGTYRLFRAESSAVTSSRISPRIAESARVLWMIYVGLTAVETALLLAGGMSLFDSVCHSMPTIATGGFSTRTQSIAAFKSAYVDCVVIVFMFLAGCNFSLHFQALKGKFREVLLNPELRLYAGIIFFAIMTVALILFLEGTGYGGIDNTLRYAAFQVVSVGTCTGFATADFDRWPEICRFLLFLLMISGACSGSTSGALKIVRVLILGKLIVRELRKMVHPRGVFHVKVGGRSIDEGVVSNVAAFCALYLVVLAVGSMALAACGFSFAEAASSAATAMANCGPGLGSVGPASSFANVHWVAKWILCALMLIGRLEIFAIAVLLLPFTWKR